MPKTSNREKILSEGLRVVHERGFEASSVRDIVQAAGVPQGSFTNHFTSKEAFGLEILELYFASTSATLGKFLRNDELEPLERIKTWIQEQIRLLKRDEMRKGCLLGNFSAEASEHSEAIRVRLVDIFNQTQAALAVCLKAAIKNGDLAHGTNSDEVAGFIVSSLQGAILLSKAMRTPAPIERFTKTLFSTVLKKKL